MSREVRRVPVDFQHPTEPNPYWREQRAMGIRRGDYRASTMHQPDERFVGLCDDFPSALARWEREVADLAARTGSSWKFHVEYHLTGYQGHKDTEPTIHPFYVWEDGAEVAVPLRDADHLHELLVTQKASERPDLADYMPVFDVPADDLGWCLYETVTEGTPVTPVFATAEALIDHLATVGTEWGGPIRRESAERVVRTGHTLGSFVVTGGQVLKSLDDADVLSGGVR